MNDDATSLKGTPFNLEKHVDYADGSVVSKTLLKKILEILRSLRLIQGRGLVKNLCKDEVEEGYFRKDDRQPDQELARSQPDAAFSQVRNNGGHEDHGGDKKPEHRHEADP